MNATGTSAQDLNKILEVFSKSAAAFKHQAFSLLWVIDEKSLCFITASDGFLSATVRKKDRAAEFYEYKFQNHQEFVGYFSRLEFIVEQILNVIISTNPTAESFIQTGLVIQRLTFDAKVRFIKDFEAGSLSGIKSSLDNLQEARNTIAHNPIARGKYGGKLLESEEAMRLIEADYSKCFNHLVALYAMHQHKLQNIAKG